MPHRQAKQPHKIKDITATHRAESLPALLEAYYAALWETVEEKTGKKNRGGYPSIRSVGREVQTLQRGLTGARTLAGSGYFSSDAFLEAYLLYYWPVSFVETYLALMELEARGAPLPVGRILDLGAGPGPASLACDEFFGAPATRAGADNCSGADIPGGAAECGSTLIDANGTALAMADKIGARRAMQKRAYDVSGTQKNSAPRLTCIEYDLQRADPEDGGEGQNFSRFLRERAPGPYGIIVACHCLNELWQDQPEAYAVERRVSLLRQACEELQDGGILLVIEPAAAVAGRPALMVRDRLLSDAGRLIPRYHFSCIGPCTGSFACPAIASGSERSCHSTWPWAVTGTLAELAAEAGLDRDSAKATWFALRKSAVAIESPANTLGLHGELPPVACPTTSRVPPTSTHSEAGSATGADACVSGVREETGTAAATSSSKVSGSAVRGRVISESLLNKAGRIRYLFCTDDGLATISAHSADERAQNLGFFTLERGDIVEARGLEIRPGARNFGVADNTELSFIVKIPHVGRG